MSLCVSSWADSSADPEAVRCAVEAEAAAKVAMRDALDAFKDSQRHEERAIEARVQAALTLFARGACAALRARPPVTVATVRRVRHVEYRDREGGGRAPRRLRGGHSVPLEAGALGRAWRAAGVRVCVCVCGGGGGLLLCVYVHARVSECVCE